MPTYLTDKAQKYLINQKSYQFSATGREIEGIHHLMIDTSVDCVDGGVNYKKVIDKTVVMYPFMGGTSYSCSVNAANPGTYDFLAIGGSFSRGQGVLLNGSTAYLNTGYTLSNTGDLSAFSGYGVKRRDVGVGDTNATIGVASSGNSYMTIRSDNFRSSIISSNTLVSAAGTLAISAVWSSGYKSTTTGGTWRNGSSIYATTGLSVGNSGNRQVLIGAYNSVAGPVWGVGQPAIRVDFFWIKKDAWSDADELSIYNAITAVMVRFAR